ncbi:transposable element Tcb2 transposase [Trichonephila clavipes]|uniref:Transposable element Tcb2 transposase n=1 Tax=Trichonephila clavipes TaxID=2585209 RepID=A0A8X6VAU5_TRICX|nr:transposable element Tcb2 transposase [Trichonephila clavipes]
MKDPPFQLQNGVKQGCPLSGILFYLSIDRILQSIQKNRGAKAIVAFADDLVLMADIAQDLQELISTTVDELRTLCLHMNTSKCSTLHLSGRGPTDAAPTKFPLWDTEIQALGDGNVRRRPGAGRPRTTTSTDDRYIQLTARRNRTENATQLQRQLLLATGRRVASQTVRNRLHKGGLYARRSMVCIPLTPRHRAARRRWAAEHRDWEQHDWSQVLFTDESRFSLECDTRRVLVWRDRGTRNNPTFVRERSQ